MARVTSHSSRSAAVGRPAIKGQRWCPGEHSKSTRLRSEINHLTSYWARRPRASARPPLPRLPSATPSVRAVARSARPRAVRRRQRRGVRPTKVLLVNRVPAVSAARAALLPPPTDRSVQGSRSGDASNTRLHCSAQSPLTRRANDLTIRANAAEAAARGARRARRVEAFGASERREGRDRTQVTAHPSAPTSSRPCRKARKTSARRCSRRVP